MSPAASRPGPRRTAPGKGGVTVRPERTEDGPAVCRVNESAFGRAAEAALVDAVRAACPEAVSLVALEKGRVVGHLLFSPVTLSGAARTVRGMGLAPMAVRPERQRRGIGSRLVRAGLDLLRERGCPFVIVLGHPAYYPRFGFVPASRHGIRCTWEHVPDEAFMVRILDGERMAGVSGTARYIDAIERSA